MLRILAVAFLAFVPLAAAAMQQAESILKRTANTMSAVELQTLKYTADGTGYTFGQAYTPATAWPKIAVASQVRTIDYRNGSMRDESTFSRAEPKGGGGYPLSGQAKTDQYLSGT